MALGDKLPVVMGKEKAVANGVATLGADGKLAEAQRPTPTEAGSADLTLSNLSNRQRALRNIGGRPNRNLLDNAYFKGGGSQQGGGQFPINQRGQTSYAGGYFIDRWFLNNTNEATVAANGITIKNTSNNYVSQQKRETSLPTGQAVTVSALFSDGFLVYASGTVGDTITSSTHSDYYVQLENDGKIFSIVSIVQNASATIAAVKLELGPVQTLAYQDEDGNWQLFETPDYAEELVKCRYYFRRYGVSSLGQIYLPPALGVSGTEANFSIVSEPMRIAPTISGNGFLLAGTTGDGFVADGSASFSFLGASPLSGIITVKVTCSNRTLIPGNYYTLFANQEYGAFLDLSAEL